MHGQFQKRPYFRENIEIWPRYWPSKLKSRFLPPSFSRPTSISKWVALGSNNVSICASLGTHAYLCVQQKVCWHTSPMRTIKMLHSSMLTCITHVCSRSYISHVGMLEHSILIAPMGQHTRGFQEQNYYVMYFIKFTWFQLQNKSRNLQRHIILITVPD